MSVKVIDIQAVDLSKLTTSEIKILLKPIMSRFGKFGICRMVSSKDAFLLVDKGCEFMLVYMLLILFVSIALTIDLLVIKGSADDIIGAFIFIVPMSAYIVLRVNVKKYVAFSNIDDSYYGYMVFGRAISRQPLSGGCTWMICKGRVVRPNSGNCWCSLLFFDTKKGPKKFLVESSNDPDSLRRALGHAFDHMESISELPAEFLIRIKTIAYI